MIRIYWKYLLYILEHKKNVFIECWKAGKYWGKGLRLHAFIHDLSKFSISEFIPYAKYFYKDKEKYKDDFEKAWKHHYKNNPHHWNYWCDNCQPKPIPLKYLHQMICDWKAMSRKFGDTAQKYYLKNYKKINLEDETRLLLEEMLDLNFSRAHNYGHTLEEFAKKYDKKTFNRCFGYLKKRFNIDLYSELKMK